MGEPFKGGIGATGRWESHATLGLGDRLDTKLDRNSSIQLSIHESIIVFNALPAVIATHVNAQRPAPAAAHTPHLHGRERRVSRSEGGKMTRSRLRTEDARPNGNRFVVGPAFANRGATSDRV